MKTAIEISDFDWPDMIQLTLARFQRCVDRRIRHKNAGEDAINLTRFQLN